MYDAVALEERHKPTVVLINEGFAPDAKVTALSKGLPGIRFISESIPSECSVSDTIERIVREKMDDIVSAFIRPLIEEEESPKQARVAKTSGIVFKGTLQETNRFFYKRWQTDGLPIVPPTEEAVREMLDGTDLPPDHIVGKIIPRGGKATVEKIAINAVMAGALPTHMPLLIAGVEALLDPRALLGLFGVSTGGWTPFWIVNGPVRNEINLNCRSGALGPGDIANAAIGRAMGLILKNIGGARKGIEDMATFGNPGKYTMVIGEREEDCPWEPLHVENGFAKDDSTMTLFFPNCYSQISAYGSSGKGILGAVIYNLQPGRKGLFALLMTTQHARILADAGWTKQDIKNYICRHALTPFHTRPEYWGDYGPMPKEVAEKLLPISPQDHMVLFRDPDWIRIIVSGGPGNFLGMAIGAAVKGGGWVTRKVNLPRNWKNLVQKYRYEKDQPL